MQNEPTAELVIVTPKLARHWLARNLCNRNIRTAIVEAYARDIAGGRWQVTGDAVKFANDGQLLDGQHRLTAIVKADQPVSMFVVKNLGVHVRDVLDSGVKRSAADSLKMAGYRNANLLQAAARLALARRDGATTAGPGWCPAYSNSEIEEFATNSPELLAAAEETAQVMRSIDIAPSVIAVAWMEFSAISPDACREFFESLANNATRGAGDPRNTLLKRLASARRSGERMGQLPQLSMLVRTWNAWRQERSLSVLKTHASTGAGSMRAIAVPKAV